MESFGTAVVVLRLLYAGQYADTAFALAGDTWAERPDCADKAGRGFPYREMCDKIWKRSKDILKNEADSENYGKSVLAESHGIIFIPPI